jgi:CTP:molybdopterin cytidylyltransferase MocA
MLAAIIRSQGSSDALAATVSALIPAVAEGFLGHAVIVEAQRSAAIEKLVDATGAALVLAPLAQSWQAGARAARGDWLLLLDAGDMPKLDWARYVERHLIASGGRAALMPCDGLWAALAERGAFVLRPRALRPGLLASSREVGTGQLDAAPRRLVVGRERAQV